MATVVFAFRSGALDPITDEPLRGACAVVTAQTQPICHAVADHFFGQAWDVIAGPVPDSMRVHARLAFPVGEDPPS